MHRTGFEVENVSEIRSYKLGRLTLVLALAYLIP
jgi:hypothetical protein